MRTRTSVRNQNIVFRELFKPKDKPKPVRFASCFNCVSYPKNGRSRGECVLRGVIVEGRTMDRPCFMDRIANASLDRPAASAGTVGGVVVP